MLAPGCSPAVQHEALGALLVGTDRRHGGALAGHKAAAQKPQTAVQVQRSRSGPEIRQDQQQEGGAESAGQLTLRAPQRSACPPASVPPACPRHRRLTWPPRRWPAWNPETRPRYRLRKKITVPLVFTSCTKANSQAPEAVRCRCDIPPEARKVQAVVRGRFPPDTARSPGDGRPWGWVGFLCSPPGRTPRAWSAGAGPGSGARWAGLRSGSARSPPPAALVLQSVMPDAGRLKRLAVAPAQGFPGGRRASGGLVRTRRSVALTGLNVVADRRRRALGWDVMGRGAHAGGPCRTRCRADRARVS